MRIVIALLFAVIPAAAQSPLVRIHNISHPGNRDFEVGDRFEISITATPKQPISVRTTMEERTDWSPVIGSTDNAGQWSTSRRFDKSDIGSWKEIWTVGGKPVSPAIQFLVHAPCLAGGQNFSASTGRNTVTTCETADGRQTFATPSMSDPFLSLDGRLVPGHSTEQTQEAYQIGILEYLICSEGQTRRGGSLNSSRGGLGDETADLIMKLIGSNALNANEIRNVLAILHGAFEKPESIAATARVPARTLQLLQRLTDFTNQDSVMRQIAETVTFVQTR